MVRSQVSNRKYDGQVSQIITSILQNCRIIRRKLEEFVRTLLG